MAQEDVKTAELVEKPKNANLEKTPAWMEKDDRAGLEGITADDVRLPRLAIAQGLSPQVQRDDSQYIDGLRIGDMFNDMTGEIYGEGPIKFVPVRRDVRRIEFIPRKEGGGVRDLDVPKGDPRLDWTDDGQGNRIAPTATTFTEVVALLLKEDGSTEPIVISIKETNKWMRRAAVNLTTFITLRGKAIYTGVYSLETTMEKNDKGTFGVFVVKNARGVEDLPNGEAVYLQAKALHQGLAGKTIHVNRDDTPETDTNVPF